MKTNELLERGADAFHQGVAPTFIVPRQRRWRRGLPLQFFMEYRESFLLHVLNILEKLTALRSQFLRFQGLEDTMEFYNFFIEMS